jgi:radical SAM protein with 4Fe4S-binding SPASM domain
MRKLQNVTIEITSRCNFKCKHCCNDSGTINEKNLTEIEIKNIIDQMVEMKVDRLSLTGGEPFCDPNLFKYLEYSKDKFSAIAIATNGYLITEEIVTKLQNHGVKKIVLSIDGTKDYHNAFRGMKDAFEHAIEATRILTENGMEVKVRSIVTKGNQDSILALMDLTNDMQIKRHEILPVCPIGRAEQSLSLSASEYKEFLIKALNKIKNMGKPNITYQLKPVFYQEYLFDGVDKECKEKSLSYTCDAFDTSLEITSEGDVIPCSFVREPVFNIREKTLYEIWNSKEAIEICNTIKNHKKVGKCKDCPSNEKCNGGCYANKIYGSDINGKDIYCFVEGEKNAK